MNCASDFAFLNRKKKSAMSQQQMQHQQPDLLFANALKMPVQELIDYEEDVDTNVISLDFKALPTAMQNLSFGDPFFCSKCKASLSALSVDNIYTKEKYLTAFPNQKSLEAIIEEDSSPIKKKENTMEEEKVQSNPDENKAKPTSFNVADLKNHESVWVCEFCKNHNKVSLEPEEMPKSNDLFYVLQSATQQQNTTTTPDENQDISVIFCIDYSGSMCVTSEIKLKEELKHGLSKEEYEMLKSFIEDGASQYLPNQKTDTQWVSRKQCVLAAIESQLEDIKKAHPNRKVGVVAFNNEVILYGDGSQDPIVIAGDKLSKKDVCLSTGIESYNSHMSKAISESSEKLLDKLYSLKENGKTALGPAIALSLGLASRGKPGSTVVICTDGLANIGVGELDSTKSITDNFYEDMGIYAKERGIMVNIITIKGEGCKMEKLGQIADLTQGKVTRVNPDNITTDFKNIMKDEVVGTQVDVKVRLHPSLKFRNEEDAYLTENKSVYVKNIGNVTANTTLTFEYQIKNDVELQMEGIDLSELKEVPLQAAVTYISTQGHKLLRIITKKQLTTEDKQQAEKNVRVGLLAARATQKTSHMANLGNLERAQKVNRAWDSYLSNDVAISNASNAKFSKDFGLFKAKNANLQQHMEKRSARRQVASESKAPSGGGGGLFGKIKSTLGFSKKEAEKPQPQLDGMNYQLSAQLDSTSLAGGMFGSYQMAGGMPGSYQGQRSMSPVLENLQSNAMQAEKVDIKEEELGSSDEEEAQFYQMKQARLEDFECD